MSPIEIILIGFGILFVAGAILFDEYTIALIDWGVRKWLKLRGKEKELKELENEDIPRFRLFTKTPMERKVQAMCLITITIAAVVFLTIFYSYVLRNS